MRFVKHFVRFKRTYLPHNVRLDCIYGETLGNIKEAIGLKILTRRKEMGFKTQKALGEAVGVDRTRVSRWESGENLPDPIYRDLLIEKLQLPDNFFEDFPTTENASKSELILKIQSRLVSLNEDELREILATIDVQTSLRGTARGASKV